MKNLKEVQDIASIKDNNDNKELILFIKKLIITILFVVGLFFLYKIANIIILLIFAIFLNMLFSPFLNKMNSWHIKDGVGVIIIFAMALLLIMITIGSIVPIFIKQISILINTTSVYVNNLIVAFESGNLESTHIPKFAINTLYSMDFVQILNTLNDNLGEISKFISSYVKQFFTSGAGLIFSITSTILNIFILLIFTFFIALERYRIRDLFYKLIPKVGAKYLLSREKNITTTLYNWFRGQIILSIVMGSLTFIALYIVNLFGVGMEQIGTLALITGLLEFIPYLGPILAFIPVLAIALGISWKTTVVVSIVYLLIQQAEGNLIVPVVMGKTLSLSPFAVFLGMFIGGSLLGIVGILVAVPIVAVLQIFVIDYINYTQKHKNNP